MTTYFVKTEAGIQGPLKVSAVREMISHGAVKQTDEISAASEGPWTKLSKVKGLAEAFSTLSIASPSLEDVVGESVASLRQTEPVEVAKVASQESRTTQCPDCGGTVSKRAASCPHCGAPIEAFTEVDTTEINEVISLDSNRFLVTGQGIKKTFNSILAGLDKSVVVAGQYPETGKIDIALQSGADCSIKTTQENRGTVVEVTSTAQLTQPLFVRNALTDLAVMEYVLVRNKVIEAIGGTQEILNRSPDNNSTGTIRITRKNQLFRGPVDVWVEPDFDNVKGSVKGGQVLEFSYPVGKYVLSLTISLITATKMFTGEDKNADVLAATWCEVKVEENMITDFFVSTTGNRLSSNLSLVLEAK